MQLGPKIDAKFRTFFTPVTTVEGIDKVSKWKWILQVQPRIQPLMRGLWD